MRVLFLVILSSLLLACGGSSPSSAPSGHSAYRAPGIQVGKVQTNQYAFADDEISGDVVRAESVSSGPAVSDSTPAAKPKPKAKANPARADVDQMFVKNAWVTLELDDEDEFAPTIKKIRDTAKRLKGYIADETQNSITIKIPAAGLDTAKGEIEQLGEVTRENISVVDVTANFVDLKLRIENLRKLKTRLQELIVAGQNVKEILEVEKELARVTGQLEQLEGQMRLMQNQISYATISVSLDTSVSPGPIGWVFYGLYSGVKWLFVWD